MSVALPVPELWRANTSGLAKTGGRSTDCSHFRFRSYGGKTLPEWPKLVEAGGRSTDSSKALMSKIVEHFMLSSELKTGCGSHFRFRSNGGKTLPGWRKQVETDSSKAVMG
jgi:hypothetical protein